MSAELKKQLKSVLKELNAIDAKVAKLIKALEGEEKKAPAKKAPAKKVAAAKPAKKVAPKKKAAKKAPKEKVDSNDGTAYNAVVNIITMSEAGVTNAELVEKTGFNKKKVANILFKAKKRGHIKTEKKGVYVKG